MNAAQIQRNEHAVHVHKENVSAITMNALIVRTLAKFSIDVQHVISASQNYVCLAFVHKKFTIITNDRSCTVNFFARDV